MNEDRLNEIEKACSSVLAGLADGPRVELYAQPLVDDVRWLVAEVRRLDNLKSSMARLLLDVFECAPLRDELESFGVEGLEKTLRDAGAIP